MTEQSRPARANEVRAERRRQRGATALSGLKLGVREDLIDRKNFEYRFINDDGRRVAALTEGDDWDLVRDPTKEVKGDGSNEGSLVSVIVGKDAQGRPMKGFLARKRKDFYAEDQAEKQVNIDETVNAIARGQHRAEGDLGKHGYIPGGANQIQDGRR